MANGGGGDCKGCGIGIGPGDQTGTSVDIDQFIKDYGIDKWWRKNINGDKISTWWKSKVSMNTIFSRHKDSGPPPNRSSYVNLNSNNFSGAQRIDLINRFQKAGINPYAKADVSEQGIARLHRAVKGLNQAYVEGGRPNHTFDLVGNQYEAITENNVNLNIGILSSKNNLHFAGVLFHEYRHAFQYSQPYTIGNVKYKSRYVAWTELYGPGNAGEGGRWNMMELDAYSAQYRFGDNEPYVLERMNKYYMLQIEWIR